MKVRDKFRKGFLLKKQGYSFEFWSKSRRKYIEVNLQQKVTKIHWSKCSGKRKAIPFGLSWKSGISSKKDFYWINKLITFEFWSKSRRKYIEVNLQEKVTKIHWSKCSGKRKAITCGLSWKSGISSEKDFYWKNKVIAFEFWSKSRRKYIEVNLQQKVTKIHWSKYSGKRKAITRGLSWKSGISSKKDFYWKNKLIAFDFWSKSRRKYIEVNLQQKVTKIHWSKCSGKRKAMTFGLSWKSGISSKKDFYLKNKVISFDVWSKSRRKYIEVNLQQKVTKTDWSKYSGKRKAITFGLSWKSGISS